MDVREAIRQRRSVRIFKVEPIPKEKLEVILDAGRWAPTGCNKQLFEVITIEELSLRRQVARLSNNQTYFYQAPVILLVLYDAGKEIVSKGVAPDVPAISAGAFVQNMLLQAYELGIGSLVVSAITKKRALRELLKIPDCYEPMCFVLLGVPDEEPFPPPRREADSFVHLNRFGNLISGKKRIGSLYPNSPNPRNWSWAQYVEFKNTIIHYAGPLGVSEPIGINSLTMHLLDIVAMRIESLESKKTLDLFPSEGLFLRSLAWRLAPNYERLSVIEFSKERAEYIDHILMKEGIHAQTKALVVNNDQKTVFPFEEGSFDSVTCFFRLESIPSRLQILQESSRVLRNNGVMFIAFFNKWGPYEMIRRTLSLNKPDDFNKRWHWLIGPWEAPSTKSLQKELNKTGFELRTRYQFYDLPSIFGLLFARLLSLVGIARLSRTFSYSSATKESGFFPSVVLFEVCRRRS